MKLKISEDLISEFIGSDLEPIEGKLNPVRSKYTSVDVPFDDDANDEDNIPQTTDKFIQHARRPWWWSNVYGGYGFTSVGTVSESTVKEDIIKTTRDDTDLFKKEIPSIDNLDTIYDMPLVKKQVVEFIEMLQSLGSNIPDEDEKDVLAIILNYMLTNVNLSQLSPEYKNKIKNAIK